MAVLANNPICWVHFRLAGGWRKAGFVAAIYLVTLLGLPFFVFQISPQISWAVLAGYLLPVLQVIQMLSLGVIGCSSIRKQIQRDFASKMIESHRLTPMTGLAATLGYALGPNLILLAFNGAVLASGLVLSPLAGKPVGDWLMFNGILAWLTLLVWIDSAFFSLATGGTFSFLAVAVVVFLSGGIVLFLPGLAFLMGMYGFTDLASVQSFQLTITDLTLPCMFLQGLVTAVFLYGAARKFRGLHIRAFPVGIGLLLVALLAAASAMGLYCAETGPLGYRPGSRIWTQEIFPALKLALSLLAVNLVALNPVATAAFDVEKWRQHRQLEPEAKLRRPIGFVAAALPACGLNLLVTWGLLRFTGSALTGFEWTRAWLLSGVILFLTLLSTGSVFAICYRAADKARWSAVIWLMLLAVGPVILDGIYMTSQMMDLTQRLHDFQFTWLTASSPVGAMLLLWQPGHEDHINIGLDVQAAITVFMLALLFFTRPKAGPRETQT